jgi:diguanylate cyclase (GGDEF)-like protein
MDAAFGDAASGPESKRHISGLYTYMLISSLQERLPRAAIERVLLRAAEDRDLEELSNISSWSSYHQFRRLLEEAKVETNSLPRDAQSFYSDAFGNTEIAESMRALGSPGAVLATGDGSNPLVPIRHYQMTEVGPTEWTIGEGFIDGFEAYSEFCDFVAWQYAVIPIFFGLPPATVVEEKCQCRGDAACLFRFCWAAVDEGVSRIASLEMEAELLKARLEQLQGIVTDLASNERYEDVLQGIVHSAIGAAGAGSALMALEKRVGIPRRVYSEGLSNGAAQEVASRLLEGTPRRSGVIAVDVTSARRRYGVLAIGEEGGVFASQCQGTLETYARLAAAALDAADSIEDARHQANTATILLELSTSLAEIVSTGELASKVARAVPDVVDCDRAAIFLNNGSDHGPAPEFRLAGSHGYPAELVAAAGSRVFAAADSDIITESGLVERSYAEFGTVASVAAPITVAGETAGFIVAGVTSDPERVTVTPTLAERLKGLAAQASIAISNSRLVDQIRFQALHDALTGLPNRSLIMDRTEQMLARARRTHVPVAVLFIDLDGFKEVNDTLGHAFGDQLLQAVTERLSVTMRQSDSVGRLGGDEFVVLVDGATMDAAPELVAERLLDVLRPSFELDGASAGSVNLSASIGIARGIRPTAGELLRDADIALYAAKAAGKDRFVVFDPEMHTTVQDHLLLEMDLRAAKASNEYFLVYQPIFNLADRKTTGVEALLRWNHSVRGVLDAEAFMPVLEDSGMIVEVGRWVLEEACRQGAHWHELGYRLDVSVNVSTRQLETDQFLHDVRFALDASGFDARSLIIEITETSIMRNMDAAIPRLAALKATGVRIAVDDFGTGYSSLAYLQQFPVDTLKIDRSFIASMVSSSESGVLVRTLVQLGKTLGLEILAEGIEECGQYSQLEQDQCDSGQGYLYARPLQADAVEPFLARLSSYRRADLVETGANDLAAL